MKKLLKLAARTRVSWLLWIHLVVVPLALAGFLLDAVIETARDTYKRVVWLWDDFRFHYSRAVDDESRQYARNRA